MPGMSAVRMSMFVRMTMVVPMRVRVYAAIFMPVRVAV
jgi:hypothetical protein